MSKFLSVIIPAYNEEGMIGKTTDIITKLLRKNGIENEIIFINDGKSDSIKIKQNDNKKNIIFEVDDFSKARLIIKDYCVNENLEVYETDDTVSLINKELVLNNINVYRISEATNTLENDFFKMIGKSNDKSN